ncbi:hypothetical protein EJ03DRAFT_350155 [Teratosphaeria nubilosa]|uniref:FAD-binding oxidoreductase/transferase type 4 C-terminal domain-containing protein n=1 Tax=Teratosphaeria nubilosa TaxID=161662 RepID=A0A6G1LEK6_9PEZI|nr:hypothetical protein EJ03DRAFT_350155 [Teratosphaeria nubilosa]
MSSIRLQRPPEGSSAEDVFLARGEHAIGLGKKDCLVTELGEDTIDLMRTVKAAVDPKWIMNPGKIFDLQRSSR